MMYQQFCKIDETINIKQMMINQNNFKEHQINYLRDDLNKGQKTIVIDIEEIFISRIKIEETRDLDEK